MRQQQLIILEVYNFMKNNSIEIVLKLLYQILCQCSLQHYYLIQQITILAKLSHKVFVKGILNSKKCFFKIVSSVLNGCKQQQIRKLR